MKEVIVKNRIKENLDGSIISAQNFSEAPSFYQQRLSRIKRRRVTAQVPTIGSARRNLH